MTTAWKSLGKRELLRVGERLRVFAEHIRLPDGREIEDYLQFSTPPFATIVAQTCEGLFVCERHYKHGPKRTILSLPAGGIEGEDAQVGAKRELLEETGYASEDWQALASWIMHGNAGGGTTHSFLARNCRKIAEPESGDLEEIEVELLSASDIMAALASGEMPLVSDVAALLPALMALGLLVPNWRSIQCCAPK
ncbi:MAG: NUDIX hydrolase [Alphaproteobacteria bacterium]|nr:NUDIX hydrolase [Alphaproteobacteria bacterium]